LAYLGAGLMAAVPKHLMQHAFTSGEMAPDTLARQDLSRYASGAQFIENFQIAPSGALFNDTGTVFVNSSKFPGSQARLIRFVFSNSQAYIVELGNLYARFYTLGGQIQNPPGTPVEVVTPYLSSELNAINYTQSGDYLYLTHQNHPPAALVLQSNILWMFIYLNFEDGPYQTMNLDPTKTITASGLTGSVTLTANFNAFYPGNVGAPIRLNESITTVYEQWASGVCYPNGALVTNAGFVYECTNGGDSTLAAWAASTSCTENTVLISSGNFYAVNTTGTTGSHAPAFTSGTQTIDAISYSYLGAVNNTAQQPLGQWQNGVAYPLGYYVYWGANCYVSLGAGTSGNVPPTVGAGVQSDGGVYWQFIGLKSGITAPIQDSGTVSDGNLMWEYLHSGFGTAVITGYTSSTTVTATVTSNQLPNGVTGGTLNWWLGAWDSYNGYPAAICFYEKRLCLGGTPNFPADIWMSNTDDYYNMAPTTTGTNVEDTNSIHVTLESGQVNVIEWMLPVTRLLVGTQGSEWQVWQANPNEGFSPSNVQTKQMSAWGSAPIRPQLIDLSVLYCHRSEKRIYEATYNYLYDLYRSVDLNFLADHIMREGGGIIDTAVQLDPYPTLWVLRADGVLVGLTYIQQEQVTAWHRHVLQGTIESIACIPNPQTNSDQLWMIVNRTINGQTARYVETMAPPFYPKSPTDIGAMWYVECGLSVQGAYSTISGLGYLQGAAIVSVVDGAPQPTQVVPPSGEITLQAPSVNQVVIGLPMTSTLKILPLDFESQRGTMQGRVKRVNRFKLRLLNSVGFSVCTDKSTIGPVTFRSTAMNMNQPPLLYTGDWPPQPSPGMGLPQGVSDTGVFTIKQTQPYPLNILGIIPDVTGNEADP
jgi:hypothetical protein